jgi:hypothetical protein
LRGRGLKLITGAANREEGQVMTTTGIIDLCTARSYEGLRDNHVSLIDCVSSKTYDLCEIIKGNGVRTKQKEFS